MVTYTWCDKTKVEKCAPPKWHYVILYDKLLWYLNRTMHGRRRRLRRSIVWHGTALEQITILITIDAGSKCFPLRNEMWPAATVKRGNGEDDDDDCVTDDDGIVAPFRFLHPNVRPRVCASVKRKHCITWQTIFHLLSIQLSRSKLKISLNENLNSDDLNEKHSDAASARANVLNR